MLRGHSGPGTALTSPSEFQAAALPAAPPAAVFYQSLNDRVLIKHFLCKKL